MGKKVQDLSERVAKLDNGKIHTLSAAEEEVLDECGIQKEMELQCPNIDMISEFADRYVINNYRPTIIIIGWDMEFLTRGYTIS